MYEFPVKTHVNSTRFHLYKILYNENDYEWQFFGVYDAIKNGGKEKGRRKEKRGGKAGKRKRREEEAKINNNCSL
jgi:hypothetical protein